MSYLKMAGLAGCGAAVAASASAHALVFDFPFRWVRKARFPAVGNSSPTAPVIHRYRCDWVGEWAGHYGCLQLCERR